MLEFGVLGPVRVVRDGRELELGGPKPRAVLALLLLAAGRVVPAEYLAEALWRGAPPPGAAKTLRSYVSRLHSLLGPDAGLAGRGGGYALGVAPDQLDADRFERLVGAARVAAFSFASQPSSCSKTASFSRHCDGCSFLAFFRHAGRASFRIVVSRCPARRAQM